MKLVCDSCGAKYSIGDDKVAGKVFKIRCKKCANVIVVRGTRVEAAVVAPSFTEEWHAVIDGAQAGPFARAQLLRKYSIGEITDDTFVWREGMEEWGALSSIAELADVRSPRTGAGSVIGATAEADRSAIASADAALGEAKAAFAINSANAAFGEAKAAFAIDTPRAVVASSLLERGSFDAAPRDWSGAASKGRSFVRLPSPRDVGAAIASAPLEEIGGTEPAGRSADAKLHGERNENSVLFTLGNLAKLASTQPVKAASGKSATVNEGSGLIDIRALAGTFTAGKTAPAAASIGTADDLPVFSAPSFGEPIALAPLQRAGTDRRLRMALVAALAMLAIVAAVLVLVVMRDSDSPQASTAGGPQVATLGNPSTGAPEGTATGTPASGTATGNSASGTATGNSTSASGTATGNSLSAPGSSSPTGATGSMTTPTGSVTTPTGSVTTTTGNVTTPTGNAPTNRTPSSSRTATTRTSNATTSSTTATTTSGSTSTANTPRGPQTTRTPNTPVTPSLTVKQPDKQECTDVHCAYIDYAEKCCEVFKPKSTTTTTTTNTISSSLPENLDKDALKAGIATIRAQVCGNKSNARGDVNVSVKVSADGVVTGVTIKSSPDPVLSSCVIAAAQKGTFAKTKRGGSFAYFWRF